MTLNLEQVEGRPADEPERPGPPTTTRPSKPFWRRPWIIPLALGALLCLYLLIKPFVGVPEMLAPLPPHDDFPLYYTFLMVHMAGGTLALLTVVLQVWPWLRRTHPTIHRVSGRVYVAGALAGGISGLVIVWWAPPVGKVGIIAMTLTWLFTTTVAFVAARRRKFALHRRFMLYSFAIIANNIWIVPGIHLIVELQIPLDLIYLIEGARWIGWVGNLMLVQWWLYRTSRLRLELPPGVVDRSRVPN